MSNALPQDWPTSRLGKLIVANYGKGLAQAKRHGGDVPVYGSNGVVGHHNEAITNGPTIIIGRKGSSGAVNFSPSACWPIDTTYYIDEPGPFSLEFLDLLLRSLGLEELDRSTAIPGLNRDDLYAIEVPVPPKTVQHQIVRFITASGQLGVSARGHLAAGRRSIERFRQAVLAAACSGRLTADWRAHNDGTVSGDLVSTVPSSVVADREVPSNWVVARVADIGTVQLGGTPSRKHPAYWDGDVNWVSSGEVANCRITSTRETISELGLANSSAKVYPVGTVLIAMIGEGKTRGQAAILDVEAATNQNAAGILAARHFVDPEYLWRWALAGYETTRAAGTGGNQPALNKQRVADLVTPVPPLDEQAEIVRRVDQLLQLAEGLQKRIDNAAKRVDRSSQAVLAKAFRGELLAAGEGVDSER